MLRNRMAVATTIATIGLAVATCQNTSGSQQGESSEVGRTTSASEQQAPNATSAVTTTGPAAQPMPSSGEQGRTQAPGPAPHQPPQPGDLRNNVSPNEIPGISPAPDSIEIPGVSGFPHNGPNEIPGVSADPSPVEIPGVRPDPAQAEKKGDADDELGPAQSQDRLAPLITPPAEPETEEVEEPE
jgi:hypothetical protein